jgi:hypothetical protein
MNYEMLSFYYLLVVVLFELKTTNKHMLIWSLCCGLVFMLVGTWLYNYVFISFLYI